MRNGVGCLSLQYRDLGGIECGDRLHRLISPVRLGIRARRVASEEELRETLV